MVSEREESDVIVIGRCVMGVKVEVFDGKKELLFVKVFESGVRLREWMYELEGECCYVRIWREEEGGWLWMCDVMKSWIGVKGKVKGM